MIYDMKHFTIIMDEDFFMIYHISHVLVCVRTYVLTHTYIHTYIDTYIHTYPAGKCTYMLRTLYVQARTYEFGTDNIRNESFLDVRVRTYNVRT